MKYLIKSAVLTFNTTFLFRLEGHPVSLPFFYWDYYKKFVLSNDWEIRMKSCEASSKVYQLLAVNILFLFCSVLSFSLDFLRFHFLLDLPYLIFCTDKMYICALRTEWITKPHLQPIRILEFRSTDQIHEICERSLALITLAVLAETTLACRGFPDSYCCPVAVNNPW